MSKITLTLTNENGTLRPLEDIHNAVIITALNKCGGNISQAARELGIHRRSLQRKRDRALRKTKVKRTSP